MHFEKLATKNTHCPVCGYELFGVIVFCSRCKKPHHRPCWDFIGKCSLFGCSSSPGRKSSRNFPMVPRQNLSYREIELTNAQEKIRLVFIPLMRFILITLFYLSCFGFYLNPGDLFYSIMAFAVLLLGVFWFVYVDAVPYLSSLNRQSVKDNFIMFINEDGENREC